MLYTFGRSILEKVWFLHWLLRIKPNPDSTKIPGSGSATLFVCQCWFHTLTFCSTITDNFWHVAFGISSCLMDKSSCLMDVCLLDCGLSRPRDMDTSVTSSAVSRIRKDIYKSGVFLIISIIKTRTNTGKVLVRKKKLRIRYLSFCHLDRDDLCQTWIQNKILTNF